MKTIFLSLVLLLLIFPSHVQSQLPSTGYIGLFIDEYHTNWCINGSGYYEIELWIWCLPSQNGLWQGVFAIQYPNNVIEGSWTHNDDESVFGKYWPI